MTMPLGLDQLKNYAEEIILSQTEDIVYLSICEMVNDFVIDDQIPLTSEEMDAVVDAVDSLCRSARIEVKFVDY